MRSIALDTGHCCWCGRKLTWWIRARRFLWAPWWCDMTYVWRYSCSPKCREAYLVDQLNHLAKESER